MLQCREINTFRSSETRPDRLLVLHTITFQAIAMVFLFVALCSGSSAQDRPLQFKSLNLELSDHGIRAIIQDEKGYMWFGGESGLNKFDGVNMKIYSRIPGDSASLTSNSIISFCETRAKELWIGTSYGLNLYDGQKDEFTQFYFSGSDEEYDFNFIQKIIEDDKGNVWIATLGGLCLLDRETSSFHEFECADQEQYALNKLINALFMDSSGRILCSTEDGQILEFDIESGLISNYLFDNGETENAEEILATNFIETYDGIIWATTTTQGLIKIDSLKNGHVWYNKIIPQKVSANSLSHLFISGMVELDSNIILFSTENGGLNTYAYKEGVITNYLKGSKEEPNAIGGNSIWTIYKDRKGLVWLGIFNVGVNVIDNRSAKFSSYSYNHLEPEGLTHSAITSFIEDEKGNMWLTADGGGLEYWDRLNNVFKHHRYDVENKRGILSNAGLCLHYTKSGDLWVGYYAGGIVIIKPDGTIQNLTTDDGLSSNHVFSVAERENGKIYIATYSGGLDVYNPETGDIKSYLNESFGYSVFRNMQINLIYIDTKDRLWLGFNNGGLFLMEEKPGVEAEFRNFLYNSDDRITTGDNTVLCITEDENGYLWIGSRDGLHKFNLEDESFRVYRMEDGLPSNTIVGVLEDENGNLWISSLNGLSQFNPETEVFRNYNVDDGLQGQKFSNRNAVYKSSKGELFFGGNNGFTFFNPNEIVYDSTFEPVYLTDFKLFNQNVEIGGLNSPLNTQISETESLELSHKQSVFTIEYVGLYFLAADKIQYAYMLEGLEKRWNYVGKKRSATYTNLDAGEYTFKVKSTNAEGDWNTNYTSLTIVVNPPWWETMWFRLIVLSVISISLYSAFRLKLRRVNQQKILLQKTVNKRTQELYEKNTELEGINEEVIQQKEELLSQAEVLERTNKELAVKTEELSHHKVNLEGLVAKRTAQLEKEKERAEESDRLKSAFLANMSHEIRTPLNAIVGFSHLLDEPDITKEDQKEFIESIDANTVSLLKLIDDILDLSMIESNQIHIDKSEIHINKLMNEVYSNASLLNKNVELKLSKPEGIESITIYSDYYRIKQILLNLFNNACKFTEQGYVEFGCELKTKGLLFYVKDTGIGISKENLDVIFSRFRKVTDEKTKLFRGAGLGLAISKKLTDLLGGELHVDSELGKGTKFTLVLPAYGKKEKKEVKRAKASYKTGVNWEHNSLLIVEDEKTNYDYLKSVLKSTRINVTWALNGKDAVDLFRQKNRYDVVLMDIKMPEMNGYDATLAIKTMAPDQVVIAQTAFARQNDIKEIKNAGFDAYLVKPIIPKDLIELLRKNLF